MNGDTTSNQAFPLQHADLQTAVKKRRLDYIDVLRALACLWVLLHHSFRNFPVLSGIAHYPMKLLVGFSNIGWLGVSLFLVLSGFCLFYPLAARSRLDAIQLNIPTFARRRAIRILPPYYAALILLATLKLVMNRHNVGTWEAHADFSGKTDILLHLVMLFNLTSSTIASVNTVFWSLALECQLYLIFPLLVLTIKRFGLQAALLSTLLISLVWQSWCFQQLGFSMG